METQEERPEAVKEPPPRTHHGQEKPANNQRESLWQIQSSDHWQHEYACMEIEIEMPKSARGWK